MLARNIIQKLEDSQLVRIFLDFVQTYHLQYEKINKEISYKCHEATWVLATTKATGYGRTQSEAYKHALRNLLEILVEDENYSQFFEEVLTDNRPSNAKTEIHHKNQEQIISKSVHDKDNSYAYEGKSKSKCTNERNRKPKQHKTEAYEYESKYMQNYQNMYCVPPVCPKPTNKDHRNNYDTNTSFKNDMGPNHSNSAANLNNLYSHSKKNYTEQNQYNSNKREVYHSKINLDISGSSSKNKKVENQLAAAQRKMLELQEELRQITSANDILREKLNHQNEISDKGANKRSQDSESCLKNKSKGKVMDENMVIQQRGNNQSQNSKVFIPKLKLDILPNYHKKSQKSLNESLLATYNEKHGGSRKVI